MSKMGHLHSTSNALGHSETEVASHLGIGSTIRFSRPSDSKSFCQALRMVYPVRGRELVRLSQQVRIEDDTRYAERRSGAPLE